MKRLIEQARGRALDLERILDTQMNRWVRTSPRRVEPLELRNEILREIEAQLVAGPAGTTVFPYHEVTIEALTDLPIRRPAIEAMLQDVEAAARQRLSERDCPISDDCTFHVRVLTQEPAGWPNGAPYRVRFRRLDARPGHRADERPLLMLTLSPGGRSHTYRLDQRRIDIGRVAEVRDREGRFVRRNTVCISEEHDPKGTVSRRHAHIKLAPDGAGGRVFVLHDDGSSYGTRVVRNGETIIVHPGTLGVKLRDRDLLQFGDATAVVRIATSSSSGC